MSRLDGFEDSIKGSLEHFEVPYNSADWSKLAEALDKQDRSNGKGGFGLYAAVVAGALALGGISYWLYQGADSTNVPSNTELAEGPELNSVEKTGQKGTTDPTHDTGWNDQATDEQMDNDATGGDEHVEHQSDNDRASNTGLITNDRDQRSAPVTTDPLVATPRSSANNNNSVTIDPRSNNNGTNDESGSDGSSDALAINTTLTEGCPGSSVEFKVENMPEDGIYLWNFGDGSFSNKPNPSHVYDKPGSYQVNLSVTTASGGTILNKPSSEKIEIFNAPRASFIHQDREVAGTIPHKHFENRSRNATTYQWNFGDGQTSTDEHPTHVYRSKGVYTVELIATNATGCQDKYTREVVIAENYDLGAVPAFSPDGDGNDDLFMPEKLRDLEVPFKLSIYEETGRKVYETSDATMGWNGTMNNRGDKCAPGEYVWMVEFTEKKADVEETFNGKVTLLQ